MKQFLKIFIIAFLLLSPLFIKKASSQPPPPPQSGCWPEPCPIPLDGGVSFLIAAGIAYGGKKIYNGSKKNPL